MTSLPFKERVLVAGDPNSGKTTWLVQMAVNNPDIPFFLFDTEQKLKRVAMLFGGMPENVTLIDSPDFQSMRDGIKEMVIPAFRGMPEPYGAVGIDRVDFLWSYAQDYYDEIAAGGDVGTEKIDELAKLKAQGSDVSAGNRDGFGGEWKTIRQYYRYVLDTVLTKLPCHVFLTSATRDIRPPQTAKGKENPKGDNTELVTIWEEFGRAPAGEKNLTFDVETAFGLEGTGSFRQYRLSCVKDTTRLPGEPAVLFAGEKMKPAEEREGRNGKVRIFDLWKHFCDRVGVEPKLEQSE